MKKISTLLCFSLLLFSFSLSHAQSWLWGKEGIPHPGGDGEIWTNRSVAADRHGNVFGTGYINGGLIFGHDTLRAGLFAAFLLKYDANGNELWARQSTGSGAPMGDGVAVDGSGNSYVTGDFTNTVTFGTTTATSAGSNMFLVKYDPNGNVIWVKAPVRVVRGSTTGEAVASDFLGNTFVTGEYTGTVAFGTDTLKSLYRNIGGVYLAKYDPNGNPLWVKAGTFSNNLSGGASYSVAIDSADNAYITGTFADTVVFGAYRVTSNGFSLFTTKYNTNGNEFWATNARLQSNHGSITGYSISVDGPGNAYVAGYFTDTVFLGNNRLIAPGTHTDVCFLKYDHAGNIIWAQQGFPLDNNEWLGYSLSCDTLKQGGGYMIIDGIGTRPLNLKFGVDTFNLNTRSNSATVIFQFDSAGNVVCGSVTGEGGEDDGDGIGVDPAGQHIYIGGDLVDTTIFGPDTLSLGEENPFLARWSSCCTIPIVATPIDTTVCSGDTVHLHVKGASAFYWSPPAGLNTTVGASVISTPTARTVYTIAGKSPGCIGFTTATINVDNHAVTVSPPYDTLCTGTSVVLNAGGGTGYVWSPSTGLSCTNCTNPTANPAITTQYSVVGTSSHGCQDTAMINLVVSNWPNTVLTTYPNNDTICYGAGARLYVSGGTRYLWSPGNVTADSIWAKPTTNITYSIVVSNNGCIIDTTISIQVNPVPTVNASPPQDTICTGSLTILSASGASTYVWSPVAGLSCTTCSSPGANPVVTTPYTVVGSNSFGCTDSAKINLVVSNKPVIVLKEHPANDSICNGDSAHLYVSGGTRYVWTPGNINADSIWVKPTSNTTYSVAVSNNGCPGDTILSVKVSTPVNATITPSNTICFGDSITLTATGGGSYKWSNNSTNSSIKVSPISNTTYGITVKNQVCADSAKTTVTVDVPTISACCSDTISLGSSTTLDVSGTGSFVWTPSTGLNCTTCGNPTASPTVTTTYTITSNDANNCSLERTLTVYVENSHCADFVVPNTFTPNNDGINDDFVINASSTTAYNITIYDRWGKQVYTSSNAAEYWNGRINGTENLAPDGTYYYIITASCASNNYNKKGFVEIVGEK